ncbi:hypothetical protein ISS40_10480 [Candidatus Bathyarchaeota archaeon]|nr:hypothetical protein [Candidatus Bathyarchaeota archaeon]
MGLDFSTGEVAFQDKVLRGSVTELGNAVVAFFWEGDEPRLGTLTVTLPDRSSSPLLGDRDRQIGLILGAHLAAQSGKMALVSVNLPLGMGDAAGRGLLELVQGLMGDIGKEGD